MDLTVTEVADLFGLPQEIIAKWSQEGKLPAYSLGEQIRFSSMEIENWLQTHRDEISPQGTHNFRLYRALHQADVLIGVPGTSKEEVIRAVASEIGPKLQIDAQMLAEQLLDREKMMSTGFGSGIAVPHTRERVGHIAIDRLFVVYPSQPIPYESLDGQPVHTLFFLFAHSDRNHLQLLAKISHFCLNPRAMALLKQGPSKAELLEFLFDWESVPKD